jgi:hypothetical protein
LNFFESSSAGWSPNGRPETNASINGSSGYTASNFFRLFEFVHVPSRFSGTRRAHVHTGLNSGQSRSNYGDPLIFEAPSWPFVAPLNAVPNYREPGRVNINTMPHYGGDPSVVWRSVTNNFFPTRRYQRNASPLQPPRYEIHDDDSSYQADPRGYSRAKDVLGGTGSNSDINAPWNPSQDNRASYHNLIATTRSDDANYNPRGLYNASVSRQHDPTRPALISNPFRSYMEGFTTVPPTLETSMTTTGALVTSAYSQRPMLAVDATLLRRRDMTWQPYDILSSAGFSTRDNKYNIDPAFDPLFALNFPRPYQAGSYDSRPFSGYTGNMFYRWGVTNVAGVTNPFQNSMVNSGPAVAAFDNYHSRSADYRNSDRNPFFRYQLYTKLSNLVTTRSNVYAIWVTLGYFEVERVKIDGYGRTMPSQESTGFSQGDDLPDAQRWPSGYRLVRELGSDTGEVKRHKAFALFDRTIPVGFIRGENFNVDRAFLTRRVLY